MAQATALSRLDVLTSSSDPTLRLPRILCLHGGGTNARIFRAQCRVLERELRSRCRLCYADAPFPASQPGPDVTSVYGTYGPFRSWLEDNSDNSDRDADATGSKIHEALQRAIAADDGRGATGEWVGLLGFSQGAKICASLLFSQQMQMQMQMGLPANHTRANDATAGPAFSFAILMAGRGPLVALRSGPGAEALRALALGIGEREQHLLRIPTIHVHGRADSGLELHRRMLHQYCDSRYRCVVEWDGDHRVPIKTKDVLLVAGAILAAIADTRPRGI